MDESFRAEELSTALTACSIDNPAALRATQLLCRRVARFIADEPDEVARKEAQTIQHRREYKRTWQRERYQNDAEYRTRILEAVKRSHERKTEAKRALQESAGETPTRSAKAMSSLERYRTDPEYRDMVRARSKARYHRLKAEAAASLIGT